jgi:hypothetical protein
MNTRVLVRRVRQTFGISAPRMSVRTHLSWRWKIPALVALFALIGGMWWWGFDFGQFLSGFNRSAIAEKQDRLERQVETLSAENARMRARTTELESDLSMTRGSQETLSRQTLELQTENTQMKEELAFLQKFFGDTGKPGGIAIERLTAERESDDSYRYSLLVVRGGNASDEFAGRLTLQAGIVTAGHASTIVLPDDQPQSASALSLKFKYYQRVEGNIRVPAGSQLKTLQAKVVETGQSSSKVTRSLNLS